MAVKNKHLTVDARLRHSGGIIKFNDLDDLYWPIAQAIGTRIKVIDITLTCLIDFSTDQEVNIGKFDSSAGSFDDDAVFTDNTFFGETPTVGVTRTVTLNEVLELNDILTFQMVGNGTGGQLIWFARYEVLDDRADKVTL